MVCGNVSISFRSSFSSGPLPSQKSFFYLGLLGDSGGCAAAIDERSADSSKNLRIGCGAFCLREEAGLWSWNGGYV
jgi:hypothetical protein